MKHRLTFSIILGGIIGFTFHLIWHFKLNISLLGISPHIIFGITYTLIGALVGLIIGVQIKLK